MSPQPHVDQVYAVLRMLRSVILFVGGMAGIVHEIWSHGTERPALLTLLAGMVGLPLIVKSDERAQTHRSSPDDEKRVA